MHYRIHGIPGHGVYTVLALTGLGFLFISEKFFGPFSDLPVDRLSCRIRAAAALLFRVAAYKSAGRGDLRTSCVASVLEFSEDPKRINFM